MMKDTIIYILSRTTRLHDRRAVEDVDRLRKRSDRSEPRADPDPLEELVRIVGESQASDLRAPVRQGFRRRIPRTVMWRR